MIDIRVQDCKQCGDINETIKQLDNRIAKIVKNLYAVLSLNSEKHYSSRELKTLIRYKNILLNLYYNGDYYQGFDYKQIISRVKSLT